MIKFKFNNESLYFHTIELTCQHGAESLMTWVKSQRKVLSKMKGVYGIAAFDTEAEGTPRPLYIGKAKNLYKRLYEHCKEMMPELCSDKKKKVDKKFISAFSEYRSDELIIDFIELEDELDRQWLEVKMQLQYETVFNHKSQTNKHFQKKAPKRFA
tara:strand:+ start:1133 stop:1600 length:468 start_codon:yes stop_codon:yes gene_type:complete